MKVRSAASAGGVMYCSSLILGSSKSVTLDSMRFRSFFNFPASQCLMRLKDLRVTVQWERHAR